MKESVLDVLRYLFEHVIVADSEEERDRDELRAELAQAGFSEAEIGRAFDWLDALIEDRPAVENAALNAAQRVLSARERALLSTEAWGSLLKLEQVGVLDAARREMVLDRVTALDGEALEARDLKWVALLVLFAQPDQEAACSYLENQVFEAPPTLH
jgi:Smg protein